MPLDRVTEREGRWYLRQGYLDDNGDIWVAVCSNVAPEGTSARDLRPEVVEVLYDGDNDEIGLPVAALRELLEWPPSTGTHGRAQSAESASRDRNTS